MKESMNQLIDHMISNVHDYTSTLTHKAITAAGGTSAVYNLRDYLPDPVNHVINHIAAFPWMDLLSFVALLLLVIERTFIVWARYREHKRSEAK
jgi:tRNA A37 threonylcarbamoyltransferase TsaD